MSETVNQASIKGCTEPIFLWHIRGLKGGLGLYSTSLEYSEYKQDSTGVVDFQMQKDLQPVRQKGICDIPK